MSVTRRAVLVGGSLGLATLVDCGSSTPANVPKATAGRIDSGFQSCFRHTEVGWSIEPGGHDFDYWCGQALGQLAFVGRNIAA